MIHAQNIGHELKAKEAYNVVYVRKRCPTKAVEGKMPDEAWSRRMPHVFQMRVLGCVAYKKVLDVRQTKLDVKEVKCLSPGYCKSSKKYKENHQESGPGVPRRQNTFEGLSK